MKGFGRFTLVTLTCVLPFGAGAVPQDALLVGTAVNRVPNLTFSVPRVELVGLLPGRMALPSGQTPWLDLELLSSQSEASAAVTAGRPDSPLPLAPPPEREGRVDLLKAATIAESRVRPEDMVGSLYGKNPYPERRNRRLGRGRT